MTELADPFMMSLAAASKHVRVLERASLINRTVTGRVHMCRLNPAPLAEANEWICFYERFWEMKASELQELFGSPKGA